MNRDKQRRYDREYKRRRRRSDPDYQREYHLLRKYGITLDDYQKLYDEQNGVCAICGKPCDLGRLAVDHDHETGRIRGLLCRRCNTAIGLLGDSLDGVLRAVDYLNVNFAS